jgi:hypothetical protein
MTNYVGLDVSQKTTTLCIVDGEGHRRCEVSALPRLSTLCRRYSSMLARGRVSALRLVR